MTNRDLALEFLKCYCAGDVDGVAATLAPQLRFKGPLLECDSRDDYVAALKRNPPVPGACRLLGISEGPNTVSVFYDYEAEAGVLTVAQLFGLRDERIAEILVVFDSHGLR